MKIIAVRIGEKYGIDYENYINSKLHNYEIIWIRKPFSEHVMLQWNKMIGMTIDTNEPVCVIDIDILLTGKYKELFEYPIKKGQFISIPSWWGDTTKNYKINGGFFKYYPKDCKYIFDKFMTDPLKWQQHYIINGTTIGPVNGEQYFVEDTVREKLELVILPESWCCRMVSENLMENRVNYDSWLIRENLQYYSITGNQYLYLGGEFHPDIKFVHFTHSMNKPHNWTEYSNFT